MKDNVGMTLKSASGGLWVSRGGAYSEMYLIPVGCGSAGAARVVVQLGPDIMA